MGILEVLGKLLLEELASLEVELSFRWGTLAKLVELAMQGSRVAKVEEEVSIHLVVQAIQEEVESG